jgi:hypothetical protein
MTSMPHKELLHCNGLHRNATSLLWRFFALQWITEASFAHLTLKGEGGTFRFY